LIDIPTATTTPSGSLDLGYNVKTDPNIRFGRDNRRRRPETRRADAQRNFNFAIGLLPRVTIGGRGTVASNEEAGGDIARDISANVHLLLLRRNTWC
jgi:hypothetical protein